MHVQEDGTNRAVQEMVPPSLEAESDEHETGLDAGREESAGGARVHVIANQINFALCRYNIQT